MAEPFAIRTVRLDGKLTVNTVDGPDAGTEPDSTPLAGWGILLTPSPRVNELHLATPPETKILEPRRLVTHDDGLLKNPETGDMEVRIEADYPTPNGGVQRILWKSEITPPGAKSPVITKEWYAPLDVTSVDLTTIDPVPGSLVINLDAWEQLVASARAAKDLAVLAAQTAAINATDAANSEAAAKASELAAAGHAGVFVAPAKGVLDTIMGGDVANLAANAAGAGVNVKTFGAKGDGVTDDSPAFAAAIAALGTGGNFYVPKGVYMLSAPLVIPTQSNWTLHPRAILRPIGDHDMLVMAPSAKVNGGWIDCSLLPAFTSNGVLFSGNFAHGNNHCLKNMSILGAGITGGAGIKLTTPANGNYIDWVLVDGVYITGFAKNIWLDCNTTGSWINANVFTNLTLGLADVALYVDGDGTHTNNSDGNVFQFVGQAGAGGSRTIYTTGDDNRFEGFAYDIAAPGLTPIHAEIAATAQGTIITCPLAMRRHIIDNGTLTHITGNLTQASGPVAFEPSAPYSFPPAIGVGVPLSSKLVGNQDDWLAFSVTRHTLTQTSGVAVSAGSSLNNITNPDPNTFASWALTTSDPAIVLEYNLSAEKLIQPRLMGLVFEYGLRPTRITVTATDDTAGVKTVFSTTTNDRDVITFETLGMSLASVNKLTVTMSHPKNNAAIRLVRLWAVSASALGKTWLPVFGGALRGPLEMRNNLFATPPTPTSGWVMWSDAGAVKARTSSGVLTNIVGDITPRSASYTMTAAERYILATGGAAGITVTLPAASKGTLVTIKKVDAGAGGVTVASAQLVDGATSVALSARYERVTVLCDGTTWHVV